MLVRTRRSKIQSLLSSCEKSLSTFFFLWIGRSSFVALFFISVGQFQSEKYIFETMVDIRMFELEDEETFQMRKRMIEGRIFDVKESMHTLRLAMRHTTKEMKNLFDHVAQLRIITRNVSESVRMELHEIKKIRERKLKQQKRMMEKSKRLLEESKELMEAFRETIEDMNMKMNGWLPGYSGSQNNSKEYGTIKRRYIYTG
ncbi:unnamed protein product [Litomosoides sigmodontis]|uniref:Uncharacterized protein n=1 Tax=Litomosoides sigmodontis TaxID=42156 RepID=A0A3P6URG2_LITSI|nr:unnamed protein product [Litomosoides sigmodontis]